MDTSYLIKPTTLLGMFIAMYWISMPSYGVAVTTQHNNQYRTGTNSAETILNTSNVNVNTFGKLKSIDVAGIFNLTGGWGHTRSQALYVPNVTIPGQGVRNVIYSCTYYNLCVAIDADAYTPLWKTTLDPATAIIDDPTFFGQGVWSTPVIDIASNTLYVVDKSNDGLKHFKLHALD